MKQIKTYGSVDSLLQDENAHWREEWAAALSKYFTKKERELDDEIEFKIIAFGCIEMALEEVLDNCDDIEEVLDNYNSIKQEEKETIEIIAENTAVIEVDDNRVIICKFYLYK